MNVQQMKKSRNSRRCLSNDSKKLPLASVEAEAVVLLVEVCRT